MNKSWQSFLKATRTKVLVAFTLSATSFLSTSAQVKEAFFKYDTTFVIKIETAKVIINPNLPLELTVDEVDNCAYSLLYIDHKERAIYYLSIKTETGQYLIHKVRFPKKIKIDRRSTKGKIILNDKVRPDLIGVHLFDIIIWVNRESDAIETTEKVSTEDSYFFYFKDYVLSANYYNDFSVRHKAHLKLMNKSVKSKEIFPETDFIEFTHFKPNYLVDCSKSNIAWLSVSKPYLLLFNHQLELQDSLDFNVSNWLDVDSLIKLPFYSELRRKGVFEFCAKALEDGARKNLAVQFINDSMLVISNMKGMGEMQEILIKITHDKKLQIIDSRFVNGAYTSQTALSSDKFERYLQTADGLISQNELFQLSVGPGAMPWQTLPHDLDFTKYTYLSFYKFHFLQP